MAVFRIGLALISVGILLSLSGLVDCRVPFQREIGENEQSDHLLLPSEKEEFNDIARETQTFSLPLEKTDLRRNDGIFNGERSRGFRFGRPGGCHHGKFNRRGQRKIENIHFPLAESGDFDQKMDRLFPEKREFDPVFSKVEWSHPGQGKRGRENEHMPSTARGGWLEFLLHPFFRHDDPAEFHLREDEFRALRRESESGHGFPRMDEFHPRVGEFRPEFGRGFPGEDEFHPGVDEFRPEFGRGFPGDDEFHPGRDEFKLEFVHGFPIGEEGRQHGDETADSKHWKKQEESFPQALPVQHQSEEFNSRAEELMPLPHEREIKHGFQYREVTDQPRHGHGNGHGEEEKENIDMTFPTEIVNSTFPVQVQSTEFHSSADKLSPEEILRTDLQA